MFLYQEPTNSVKRTSKVTWNCGPHLMGPTIGRLGVIRVGVLPVRVDSGIKTTNKHTEHRIIVTYFVSDFLHLTWNIFKLGLNSSPFDRFQFFALPIRPTSNIFSGRWSVLEWGKEEDQTQYGVKLHYSTNKSRYILQSWIKDLFYTYTNHCATCTFKPCLLVT